jgi:hypothetical protein
MLTTLAVSRYRHITRITRLAATLLTATTLAAAAGCGGGADSSTGPSNKNAVGIYALMQVDSKAIPTEIYHGPYFDASIPHFYEQYIAKITGGELVLQEGGRFHMAVDGKVTADGREGTPTMAVDGYYTIEGDQIMFLTDGGGDGTATLRTGTISFGADLMGDGKKMNALEFRYRK